MSDKDPKPKRDRKSSRSKQKPKVKSFLRQASAIIASERGLNSGAQQKLQTLAEYLKMPQEEFHEALALLQENEKLPAGLNRYEKEFVSFLKNELGQLNGGILTVSMENKAVDLAARKYQILEPRARKLIHDQAEALNVGRISRNEAEGYVEQLVVSRIGDATRIDDATRDRFYKIGQKWGVGTEQVDAIVLQALSENRRQESEEHVPANRSWVTVVLILLLIGTGSVFAIYAGYGFRQPKEVVDPAGNDKTAPVVATPTIVFPDWWEQYSMDQVANGLLVDTENEQWIGWLSSEDLGAQKQGVDQLVELATSGPELVQRETQSLLATYFFFNPNTESSPYVLKRIEQQLSLPASRIPAKMPKLKSNYGANRLLGFLRFYSVRRDSDEIQRRRQLVDDSITREFGNDNANVDLVNYLQTTERVIALNQWNHLIQTSWSSPNRTATLISPLYDLTQNRLQKQELQRLDHRTVMSVLESDASLWGDLKTEISRAISNAPTTSLHTWINHYQSVTIADYRDWLGVQLIDACAVEPESRSRASIAAALDQVKTRYRREQFRDLIARNQQVEELNQQVLNSYRASDVSPQLIADVAHAVNLNMVLAPSDQSSFRFQEFDHRFKQGAPILATLARQSLDTVALNSNRSATPSDVRNKAEELGKIDTLARSRVDARVTALNRLAAVAGRFEDVSYEEASVLATYYLSDRGYPEQLQAEKVLPKFIAWPNFGLALADQIVDSDADLDLAMTMAQYYGDGSYQIRDMVDWKREIARFIFDAVVANSRASQTRVSERSQQWVFLRQHYLELYQQRLRLLGGQRSGAATREQPTQLARQIVHTLAGLDAEGGDYPVDRAVLVLQRQSETELGELVALNKMTVRLLAKQAMVRWPMRLPEINSILAAMKLGSRSGTIAQELLETEVALLKLWSLERAAVAERLITR